MPSHSVLKNIAKQVFPEQSGDWSFDAAMEFGHIQPHIFEPEGRVTYRG